MFRDTFMLDGMDGVGGVSALGGQNARLMRLFFLIVICGGGVAIVSDLIPDTFMKNSV